MASVDHDMERIGRIMAADQGLEVECRGMLAYSVPGKVVIPSLENLDHLGEDAERMMHGYLDHECAHASDTDHDLFGKARKEIGDSFGDLLNAVEDGYIEGRQGLRYRGSQWNLRNKNEWFWERPNPTDEEGGTAPEKFSNPMIDPWRKFTLAMTMCVRPYGGRSVADFRALDADTFDRLMLCEDEIDEVKRLVHKPRATQDCWDIAMRIWQRFDIKSPPPKDGSKAPGRLQLDLQGWDKDREEVRMMLADPESAINQALQAILGGEDFGKDGDYDGKIDPPDDAGQNFETPRGDRPYIVFSHEYDHEPDFTGDIKVSHKYETLVEETRSASEAFVFAFEAALRSRTEKAASYGHDEGHMDPQALYEFAAGSRQADTLYTQYTADEDADDVAVHVLVDCSGSMGSYDHRHGKARLAAQAATAIHQACQSCQIEHEVGGFTTTYTRGMWGRPDAWNEWVLPEEKAERARTHLLEAQAQGQDVKAFARIYQGGDLTDPSGVRLCVPVHATFKRFGVSDARGISHITGIGANLDGEAVMWAARRLAKRREKRRVMFVLSDGQPSAANAHADEHGYLKETVQRVITAGIEVYGIGIQSRAVKEFYPIHWVANDLEDLPAIAMGALIDTLSENRQEHNRVVL